MLKPFPFSALVLWHAQHGRHDLPWRNFVENEKDRGYHVWLSEILLQQTQADRVIPFYKKILEVFPTITDLANIEYETFFPYYDGLGYYSRARNLLKAARIVSEKYDGYFPKESQVLQSLPGVGPYASEAIRAFAFDIPTLAFDTNLEKIFARYYHGSRYIKLSREEKEAIVSDFQKTGLSARIVNAALMDYSAQISKNTVSSCDFSHTLPWCLFAATEGSLEKKEPTKKTFFPTKDAKIMVILHENHHIYFSENEEHFVPFLLGATEDDPRQYIKAFFKAHHHLDVSVRPSFKKCYRSSAPYVLFRAQIQHGKNKFIHYTKEQLESYLQSFFEYEDRL